MLFCMFRRVDFKVSVHESAAKLVIIFDICKHLSFFFANNMQFLPHYLFFPCEKQLFAKKNASIFAYVQFLL